MSVPMKKNYELNPHTRFSDRVNDCTKYRPHYPAEILDFLKTELGLLPMHTIADVGAGAGIYFGHLN